MEMDDRMGKQDVKYLNMNKVDRCRAGMILSDFNPNNEKYMRSLVANITGDGEYADRLSLRDLRKESYIIMGVVRKIANSKPGNQSLEENLKVSKPKQVPRQIQGTLFS